MSSSPSRLIAAAAVAMLAATAAGAQVPLAPKFGIAAGPTVPTGDFKQTHTIGYHGQVMLGIVAPLIPFALRADVGYHRLPGKDVGGGLAGGNPDVSMIVGDLNLVVSTGGIPFVSPYLIGGAGYYSSKVNVDGADRQNDFGWNVGAGLRFGFAGVSTFAEARLHSISGGAGGKAVRMVPITVGVLF